MFALVIAVILLAWHLIGICVRQSPRQHACPRHIRDVQEARRILRNSTLESRAIPNERLVMVFGINNAFTTTDSENHRAFVCQAKDLIRSKEDEWMTVALAAQKVVDTGPMPLQDGTNTESFLIVKLVQSLVFRIVIIKFFPRSDTPSDEDVDFITTKINSLWLASKSCSSSDTAELLHDKKELLRKLNSFIRPQTSIQQWDKVPGEDNPLNRILPAYETLWRVVLHCFLEVRFRASPSDALIYKSIFEQFFNQPCQHTFETPFSPSTITVRRIVDETLRLYPPTRRINRQLSDALVAIDIEHIHRDAQNWGHDVLEFRPARWDEKKFKKMAYMSFGMGRFECPAKNTFGPMMIGVLVGTLLAGVDEEFELCLDGVGGEVLGLGPLEGGREAYVGLQLRKAEK
ncbi:hypothetical protein DL98DRAFT_516060 [Cadophora sp. DSE1049]|nr:hypothetical protein DL98DRAFT_516060 [Cadophora sp. DSE1049]